MRPLLPAGEGDAGVAVAVAVAAADVVEVRQRLDGAQRPPAWAATTALRPRAAMTRLPAAPAAASEGVGAVADAVGVLALDAAPAGPGAVKAAGNLV